MEKDHHYNVKVTWTGNRGEGTKNYKGYDRSHIISAKGKSEINASSDSPFMGDPTKYNPEDFLVASLSACHMLWYLHLCADNGICVTDYQDQAEGLMKQTDSGGHFTEVVLHPVVIITEKEKIEAANALHEQAHKHCFIANSCNFPVHHRPVCKVKGES